MAERNALAGLSETLKNRIAHHGYVYDIHRQEDVIVQRIIAELATFNPEYVLNGLSVTSLAVLEGVYANIRAIAEERGENG